MPLIPYQTFCLDTRLKPDEVAARLVAAVEPFRWFRLGRWQNPHRPFEGRVTADGFRIVRIIGYNNSFIPVLRGHICPTADGGRVEGKMTLYPAVSAFMAVWMIGFGILGVAGLVAFLGGAGFPALLVPFGMFLFGWLLTAGAFTLEARISLRRLRQILGADSETPAFPRHHENAK